LKDSEAVHQEAQEEEEEEVEKKEESVVEKEGIWDFLKFLCFFLFMNLPLSNRCEIRKTCS